MTFIIDNKQMYYVLKFAGALQHGCDFSSNSCFRISLCKHYCTIPRGRECFNNSVEFFRAYNEQDDDS